MTRILSGLSLFLLYFSAYAQTAAENVPVEATASSTVVIIFVVIFVGFCVGFMWMMYAAEKKKKAKQLKEKHQPTSGKAA